MSIWFRGFNCCKQGEWCLLAWGQHTPCMSRDWQSFALHSLPQVQLSYPKVTPWWHIWLQVHCHNWMLGQEWGNLLDALGFRILLSINPMAKLSLAHSKTCSGPFLIHHFYLSSQDNPVNAIARTSLGRGKLDLNTWIQKRNVESQPTSSLIHVPFIFLSLHYSISLCLYLLMSYCFGYVWEGGSKHWNTKPPESLLSRYM